MRIDLRKTAANLAYYSGMLKVSNAILNQIELKTDANGNIAFPIIRKRNSNNFQVLAYHRVNDDNNPFFPGVPTKVFEKWIKYLSRNFYILSIEEIVDIIKKDKMLPNNTLTITFDDGYRDNYTNVFNILKKYSISATIFLATGFIDTDKIPWFDKLRLAFKNTSKPYIELKSYTSKKLSLRSLDEKISALNKVTAILISLEESQRLKLFDEIIDELEANDMSELSDLMLTWEQIKEMHESGISFGSHTVTHPIMSKISIERAREELVESKRTIEENLGSPVISFAYPNGKKEDFHDGIKEVLKEAGYSCAFTTIFGVNDTWSDLYELRRGGPWEEYLPLFATKLNWYKFFSNRHSLTDKNKRGDESRAGTEPLPLRSKKAD